MSVELRPLGVACNIACRYCYQQQQRQAGNARARYDLEKMKAAVLLHGGPFILFGGEALLLDLADLEELFRWGHERYGSSGLQTNGVLVTPEHVRLFRTYDVRVGISIDGPGELNDLRWHRDADQTRRSTAASEAAIDLLCRDHRPPGLIVTLHRLNAVGERLTRLVAWARELDGRGVPSMRIHLLEAESAEIRRAYGLTDDENLTAMLALAALQPELRRLRFDVFDEMARALQGDDSDSSCVWHACDPYTTPAVRGIEGNGEASNCGRTNKDGVDYVKAVTTGFERYVALYHTPQEHGGCQGCRFFLMCKGQCPGTAIDGDWRNRSELCGVWKGVFTHLEERLTAAGRHPLSRDEAERSRLEARLIARWTASRGATIAGLRGSSAGGDVASAALRPRVRMSFVGEAQRLAWEPRLLLAQGVESAAALAAVVAGDAAVGRARVRDSALLALHQRAAAHDLHVCDLGPAPAGQFREVAIGAQASVDAYRQAAAAMDVAAMADLVGVPACCTRAEAYRLSTSVAPLRDYAGAGAAAVAAEADVRCVAAANPFLRAIGVALLAHVPCAPDCQASIRLAGRRLHLAQAADAAAAAHAAALLAWPLEWTSLHGLVETKTGVFRFVHPDVYCASLQRVRYHGESPAPDAARGLGFAFRTRAGLTSGVPVRLTAGSDASSEERCR